ncbi:hypothetical protein HNQ51_001574 [Inhella inkyongensis]|uniref:Uncharacterized protein n=1 Tax=Inhella inkyongensis TaxID=392593 RepID=A0A840S724_9BURK|nr:hypothetical protein [Inhella inkyongensis]MBB5204260.1 hypothetical protein [Inhella inkyongensis]
MRLQFVNARLDETDEGLGCIEALASIRAPQAPQARAELDELLAWAEAHAPGPRGPREEGGHWDAQLDLHSQGEWLELSLTVVGPLPWCEALIQQFDLDN